MIRWHSKSCGEKRKVMLLDEIDDIINEEANIKINSFYDVNQVKYTEEELQLYHNLAGMPLIDSYEQLMETLQDNV